MIRFLILGVSSLVLLLTMAAPATQAVQVTGMALAPGQFPDPKGHIDQGYIAQDFIAQDHVVQGNSTQRKSNQESRPISGERANLLRPDRGAPGMILSNTLPDAPGESGGFPTQAAEPSNPAPDEPGSPKSQLKESASPEGAGSPGKDEEASTDDEDEFGEDLEGEFAANETEELWDPLSGYNGAMTVFNDKVYTWLLDPVARGYRFIMPQFVRRGLANFFHNLLFPLRFVNNLLQIKLKGAGVELLRFTLNTTIGVLGLWDPAKVWFGLEPYEEDFGQTLGFWGVGAGPHIVLPFLGPSNLRDTFSMVPDWYLDPKRFIKPDYPHELGVRVFEEVNDTSLHIGEYENLKKDALELYPFLRDAYEQYRNQQIKE